MLLKNLNLLIVEGNLQTENNNFTNSGIQTHAESLKERGLSLLNTIYGSSTLMEAKGSNYARDTLAPILEKLVGLL